MKRRYSLPLWICLGLLALLLAVHIALPYICLLYTSPSPRDS